MKSAACYYCEFEVHRPMLEASPRICHHWRLYKSKRQITLSLLQPITLSLSNSLSTIAYNDNNDKNKVGEEAESSAVRKRLCLSDSSAAMYLRGGDRGGGGVVDLEESSMNQLDTLEGKLMAKCDRSLFFNDDEDEF
jgi:hypothetical protein